MCPSIIFGGFKIRITFSFPSLLVEFSFKGNRIEVFSRVYFSPHSCYRQSSKAGKILTEYIYIQPALHRF